LERRQLIGPTGWKAASLRDETWAFLGSLPCSLQLEIDGQPIAFYHGSPASDIEPVTAYKAPPASVDEFWDRGQARILILAHTHIPMIERGPRGTVINPGSVLGVTGIQTSYSFAVLDTDNLAVRVYEVRTGREIRRDPIDIDEA
jgi:predicted phosphodiesterase